MAGPVLLAGFDALELFRRQRDASLQHLRTDAAAGVAAAHDLAHRAGTDDRQPGREQGNLGRTLHSDATLPGRRADPATIMHRYRPRSTPLAFRRLRRAAGGRPRRAARRKPRPSRRLGRGPFHCDVTFRSSRVGDRAASVAGIRGSPCAPTSRTASASSDPPPWRSTPASPARPLRVRPRTQPRPRR